MLDFYRYAVRALATALLSVVVLTTAFAQRATELSPADREALASVTQRLDHWDGTFEQVEAIRVETRALAERYPDSVAVLVEDTRAQWYHYSAGMGRRIGGMSYIPVFLDLQRRDPSLVKPYIYAAIGYIHTADFEGAKPSLAKAREVAPDDPWVDLTWSLWHGRRIEREQAVHTARAAIPKATGNPVAMAAAVTRIVHHLGVQDFAAATALAAEVTDVEKDTDNLTILLGLVLDNYSYNPAQIAVALALGSHLADVETPSPLLLLHRAQLALYAIYMSSEPLDANALELTLGPLLKTPEIGPRARTLLIDLALMQQDHAGAKDLVDEGEATGLPATWVHMERVGLLRAKDDIKAIAKYYDTHNLRDDDIFMDARKRLGSFDRIREYYFRRIEDDPTNAHNLSIMSSFLSHYIGDIEGAIHYGERAWQLWPDSDTAYRLSVAYLAQSGNFLRHNNEEAARQAHRKAREIGFDPAEVMKYCNKLCTELGTAIDEFKEHPL